MPISKCRWLGIAVFLGLLLCGCTTAPLSEPIDTPENQFQPLPIAPDLPPVATRLSEKVIVSTEPVSPMEPPLTEALRNRSIFFLPRQAGIDPEEKEKLAQCAKLLKQDTKRRVMLIGYSDDLGSKSYNLAITEQRIAAVSSVLRSLGVERRQIRRNRSNSIKRVADFCRSEACRQRMRRVEFVCGA